MKKYLKHLVWTVPLWLTFVLVMDCTGVWPTTKSSLVTSDFLLVVWSLMAVFYQIALDSARQLLVRQGKTIDSLRNRLQQPSEEDYPY